MPDSGALVLILEAVGLEAIAEVGGKNASLGEMLRALAAEGVRVPGGFALTASAYRLLLSIDGLGDRLEAILADLDAENIEQLQRAGAAARQLLLEASLPGDLEAALLTAYRGLAGPGGFFKGFDKVAGVLYFDINRHIRIHGPRRAADPQWWRDRRVWFGRHRIPPLGRG